MMSILTIPFMVAGSMVIANAAFLAALKENNRRSWAIYTLSLTAGLYLHPSFSLLAIGHGIYSLIVKNSLYKSTVLSPYFASVQFALAAFIPRVSVWLHTPSTPVPSWAFYLSRLCLGIIAISLWLPPTEQKPVGKLAPSCEG